MPAGRDRAVRPAPGRDHQNDRRNPIRPRARAFRKLEALNVEFQRLGALYSVLESPRGIALIETGRVAEGVRLIERTIAARDASGDRTPAGFAASCWPRSTSRFLPADERPRWQSSSRTCLRSQLQYCVARAAPARSWKPRRHTHSSARAGLSSLASTSTAASCSRCGEGGQRRAAVSSAPAPFATRKGSMDCAERASRRWRSWPRGLPGQLWSRNSACRPQKRLRPEICRCYADIAYSGSCTWTVYSREIAVPIFDDIISPKLVWPVEAPWPWRRANALIERFRASFPEIYYDVYWETRLMNAQAYIGERGRSVRLYGGLGRHRQLASRASPSRWRTKPATISAVRRITSTTRPSAARSAPANGPRRRASRLFSATRSRGATSGAVSRNWRQCGRNIVLNSGLSQVEQSLR